MRLVTLATFPSPVEAALARNVLEEAGIRAHAADEAAGWAFSGMFGGVKLLVDEVDFERACELLDESQSEPLATDGEPPADTSDALADESADDTVDHSPLANGDSTGNRHESPEHVLDWIDRAWRAACVSAILLPPLFNFYSAWLLLRAAKEATHLPPRYTRRFYGAIAINLAVTAVAIVIWIAVLRSAGVVPIVELL